MAYKILYNTTKGTAVSSILAKPYEYELPGHIIELNYIVQQQPEITENQRLEQNF